DDRALAVGKREPRLVDADVHADVRVTRDVEIEVRRRTPAGGGALADTHFEHEALGEQLVDDGGDGGLGQRRALRNLGARQRARAAHGVEDDRAVVRAHHLTVDFWSRYHDPTLV